MQGARTLRAPAAAAIIVVSVVGIVCAGAVDPAPAAPSSSQPEPPRVDAASITGRDFAGLRLPVAAIVGVVEFRAMRAAAWDEPAFERADGVQSPVVRRIELQGDVVIRLGVYEFRSERAAIWMAPLGSGDPDAGAWQVYAYLDRVGASAADASAAVSAEKYSAQAVIRPVDGIHLAADAVRHDRPDTPFTREGERALSMHLRGLAGISAPPPLDREVLAAREAADVARVTEAADRLPPAPASAPIFARAGLLSPSGGEIRLVTDPSENAILITKGAVLSYWDRAGDRTLEISAERAVVYLEPGPIADMAEFGIERVRGIYVEGDVVATDGDYTLRAPRVYYDVANDRALLVNAVLHTFDQARGIPLYVRAEAIRQEAANQFSASKATISNSAFINPQLAIGASSVKLSRSEDAQGRTRTRVDARGLTLRAGEVPFFFWPRYKGDPSLVPLRAMRVENSSGSGAALKTTWDGHALFGLDKPEAIDWDLLIDGYFDRGAALGSRFAWSTPTANGDLLLYGLPYDTGTDLLLSGARRDRDGDVRGVVLGEHRVRLDESWTLMAEASYFSDETFVDAFFEPWGKNRREFASGVAATRRDDHSLLILQAKTNLNDFIANEYVLQTPGYTVEKLPEASYLRLGDDVLAGIAPGLLTYSGEARVGRLALNFVEPTARELGFDTVSRARDAFGLLPGESLGDALRDRGLRESSLVRFDTRHELGLDLDAGPVSINPFVVGRFTAYDQTFETFSPDADDHARVWGSVGVRATTTVQRVHDGVESRILDLHRLRHAVRPGVEVWHAGSSIDREDLPVYDAGVESLAQGSVVRLALDQTWQTQRGGPGRWFSTDVLKLNASLVFTSDDAELETPIGRYVGFRPELSNLGDFAEIEAAWRLTEAMALTATTTYSFDTDQPARTAAGVLLQHNPEFSSFAELRFVNPEDSTILVLGADYELSRKYDFSTTAEYNSDEGTFQTVNFGVRRRFPSTILGASVSYNNITSETSFGFVLQPLGIGSGGLGSRLGG